MQKSILTSIDMLKMLPSLILLTLSSNAVAQSAHDHLADNTLLLIRHAEKPSAGAMLNEAGAARAEAYTSYFEPFHEGTLRFKVDALYAGADSDNSNRPRLTLEPLSKATGLPLHLDAGTKEPDKLVALLRNDEHGMHPLVAWRHGQIPALLKSFGADPEELLPGGKWPDEVYDWIIVLRFDHAGKLAGESRIVESLHIDAAKTQR